MVGILSGSIGLISAETDPSTLTRQDDIENVKALEKAWKDKLNHVNRITMIVH